MDCYWFCQQCEDEFNTDRANGDNRTLFAASFLREGINTCWTQYKHWHVFEKCIDVIISLDEFKAFLDENLINSGTFVKGLWSKFRGDSRYQLDDA